MHFEYFTQKEVETNRSLLSDHLEARAKIFPDWDAPNYCGGFEADLFDCSALFETVWATVKEGDQVLAVGRMIPADGPCTMLGAVWPGSITETMPDAPTSLELHRVGVVPGLPRLKAAAAVLKIRIGLEELALAMGRPHVFFLTAEKVFQKSLVELTALGPAFLVDGVMHRALGFQTSNAAICEKRARLEQLLVGAGIGKVA